MNRWDAYLTNATNVIRDFDGRVPLSAWLKDYFRLNKQMGSTDRKIISGMVYSYYRLGFALRDIPVREKVLCGLLLCSQSDNKSLAQLKPAWNMRIHENVSEKVGMINEELAGLQPPFSPGDIFPWKDELSADLDTLAFSLSFLQQPDLFLRLRPGKETLVTSRLEEAGIQYKKPAPDCLALPNATKADAFVESDSEAVIQDFSSQRTGDYFFPDAVSVWDCCAGSGGKSIMAYDTIPAMQLTVSDVRKSILENLEARFARAGIKEYTSSVTDLSNADCQMPPGKFDLIIADLPCTGSGTWARTPEQLYFFNPSKISHYSNLQRNILQNVTTRLRPGGHLVYITCSVFKKENEDVATFVSRLPGLQLQKMILLKGYDIKADSMFVAVFENKAG
jgi:16S rRNA (cytosine967-C5)-methyltransferase